MHYFSSWYAHIATYNKFILPSSVFLICSSIFLLRYSSATQYQQLELCRYSPADSLSVHAKISRLASEKVTVADFIKNDVNAVQDSNRKLIQKAFPLTQDAWQHMYACLDYVIAHDPIWKKSKTVTHKKADHPVVKKARKLLASYGIDTKQVIIYCINNPKSLTNAMLEQGYMDSRIVHRLAINIPSITKLAPHCQEAVLRHEIMHLVHYDPLERGFIETLLEKHGFSQEIIESHESVLAFYKHQEFRADLMAACSGGISIAQAFHENFSNFIRKYPEDNMIWTTHPSDTQRRNLVTILISFLEAEEEITARSLSSATKYPTLA